MRKSVKFKRNIFVVWGALMLSAGAILVSPSSAESQKPWQMGKPIVTYWVGPTPLTDADAKQISEGGFNVVKIHIGYNPKGMTLVEFYCTQLDLLHRYGLRGIVGAGAYYRDPKTKEYHSNIDDPVRKDKLDKIIEAVKKHPALYGYAIKDEPNRQYFDIIAKTRAYIQKQDPNHMFYMTLLPLGCDSKPLVDRVNVERVVAYKEYVKEYIEILKPEVLAFDHYNFADKGQDDSFFLNLAVIRDAALEHDIPFMAMMQASTWVKGYPITTGEQWRWLANTSLAYGAQGISWYVYAFPGHDGGFAYMKGTWYEPEVAKMGRVVLGGEPTANYYFAKEVVHKEFLNIATELKPLTSQGVYHMGMLPEGTIKLPKDNEFKLLPEVKEKPCPGFVGGSYQDSKSRWPVNYYEEPLEGFVMGCFGEKNWKATHAFIVNLDYRTYSARGYERADEFNKPVRREIVGPSPLEVFDAQTGKWSAAGSNRAKLSLPPGGGILVRIAQ